MFTTLQKEAFLDKFSQNFIGGDSSDLKKLLALSQNPERFFVILKKYLITRHRNVNSYNSPSVVDQYTETENYLESNISTDLTVPEKLELRLITEFIEEHFVKFEISDEIQQAFIQEMTYFVFPHNKNTEKYSYFVLNYKDSASHDSDNKISEGLNAVLINLRERFCMSYLPYGFDKAILPNNEIKIESNEVVFNFIIKFISDFLEFPSEDEFYRVLNLIKTKDRDSFEDFFYITRSSLQDFYRPVIVEEEEGRTPIAEDIEKEYLEYLENYYI